MTPGQDVSDQRQRLRVELRNRRKSAHLTQTQVARAMDWSPSKMLRIEAGAIGISTTDLRALLAYYDIKDERQTEELVALARASRTRRCPVAQQQTDPEDGTTQGALPESRAKENHERHTRHH
jgi:transcriptional regulator with XRE-family HTH domain